MFLERFWRAPCSRSARRWVVRRTRRSRARRTRGTAPLCPASGGVCPSTPLTFADVAPIVTEKCGGSSCHGPNSTKAWPITTDEHVVDWWPSVNAYVEACTMPPAGSPRLTAVEQGRLLDYLSCRKSAYLAYLAAMMQHDGGTSDSIASSSKRAAAHGALSSRARRVTGRCAPRRVFPWKSSKRVCPGDRPFGDGHSRFRGYELNRECNHASRRRCIRFRSLRSPSAVSTSSHELSGASVTDGAPPLSMETPALCRHASRKILRTCVRARRRTTRRT